VPGRRIGPLQLCHLDVFNHLRRLVLQDDHLVSDHSRQCLPLLLNALTICLVRLMHLHLATTRLEVLGCYLHHFVDVLLLATAFVLK
jgi:hypothetical protein